MIDKIKKLALKACNMKDSVVLLLCAAVQFVIYLFVDDNIILSIVTLVTLPLLVIGSMIVSQLEKLNGDD